MPRANTNPSEDEVIVKKTRAPRKPRAILREGDSDPKPRKRAPSKIVEKKDVKFETFRKAPTEIASTNRIQKRSSRAMVAVAVFCMILTGSGVGLGLSDKGEINVVAVVNDRNEKINRGEVRDEKTGEAMSITVPVQVDDRPNGGLKLSDTPADQILPPVTSESEISSSTTAETTSTSTESVTEIKSTSTEPEAAN